MLFRRLEKDVRDINRLKRIVEVLFKHEFGYLIDRLHLKHLLPLHKRLQSERFADKHAQPSHVREIFEELGGAFPKLGQLLSLRPDLLPPAYCDELRKLQDAIPPVPFEEVKRLLEQTYEKPLTRLFRKFDPTPVASASIAQVHKAIRRDGALMAVKVQRPDIEKTMRVDIEIIEVLAKQLKRHLHPVIFDPVAIAAEFKRYTQNELDFVKEGKNIDLFHEHAVHNPTVKIPEVDWKLTREHVLVMEFIKGQKLSDWQSMGSRLRKELALKYVKAILTQVFEDGFFHGDPHPGNIIITEKKQIAFLDFGIVGYFDSESKKELLSLFISLMSGNLESLADELIDLNIVDVQVNEQKLKDDIFLNLSKYYNSSLDTIKVSQVIGEMLELARSDHILVPANFVLLLKTVVTVESVAQNLDPSFNLFSAGTPFLVSLAKKEHRPMKIARKLTTSFLQVREFVQKVPKQSQEIIRSLRKGDELVQSIDTDIRLLVSEMDRSSNRISLGLLITALFLSSAFTMQLSQPMIDGYPLISLLGFGFGLFFVALLVISLMRD
ncbi:MAG: AarF/ABC1/UbiB kinase family protein [DPANN group archaeon]|nr:AarF/ABC1/UbiB kinase family protein [DPANN group archaeon]